MVPFIVGTNGVRKVETLNRCEERAERSMRVKRAMATYQSDLKIGSISAMPVLINFEAKPWCEFRLYKRGEEHVFTNAIEKGQVGDLGYDLPTENVRLNSHAIRDDFQKVKTPMDALDFLNKTGRFSLLDVKIPWSYFKRWQRFAYLVQEHDSLADAMKSGNWAGECGEVLKALSGEQVSTFFDGSELQPIGSREQLEEHARWMVENADHVREELRIIAEERTKLCAWFRQPPDEACSIEWIPRNEEDAHSADAAVAGGTLVEYLFPQEAMRPVLLISPTNTLEAIAAAIYADRIEGVEYRACEVCSDLFEVGTRGEKKYCSRERCKNTAHQRRMRANRSKKRKAMKKESEA